MYHNGTEKPLAGPEKFTAKVLNNTTLPAENRKEMVEFYKQVTHFWSVMEGVSVYCDEMNKQVAYIQQALQQNNEATLEMKNQAFKVKQQLEKVEFAMNGTPAKASWEEVPPEIMPLNYRLMKILEAAWQSTSTPTANQKKNYDILMQDLPAVLTQLTNISTEIDQMNAQLDTIKADYTPGRIPKL
jgi:septation ring formation regulator EzrA